jgi:hypothetical protein
MMRRTLDETNRLIDTTRNMVIIRVFPNRGEQSLLRKSSRRVTLMSYFLGHAAVLFGSWLDEFYDWAQHYTLNTQNAMLARRSRLLPWLAGPELAGVQARGRDSR